MGVISDSGLNVGSISGMVIGVESEIMSKSEVHVNKGENVWSGVDTSHDTRFTALDVKEVNFANEINP